MTTPVERILAVAQGVRPSGPSRWMVKNPLIHDQRTGSVAIRELPDGRVLLHDFAGSDAKDVVAAWGLDMAELYPDSVHTPMGPHHRKVNRRSLIGPMDALRLIKRETSIVTMAALNYGHGVTPTNEDCARLLVAGCRIDEIMLEVES